MKFDPASDSKLVIVWKSVSYGRNPSYTLGIQRFENLIQA